MAVIIDGKKISGQIKDEVREQTAALAAQGILSGLPIEGGMLWCATELNSKAQIDAAIAALKEVL